MAYVDDQELHLLRRRAYGPDADIHLDSAAIDRLRELERAAMPTPTPTQAAAPASADISDSQLVPPDDGESPLDPADEESPLLIWARRLPRPRRSTVLIALGVLAFATIVMVALTLVERIQTDPLQVGATQVARLSPSSSPMPPIFGDVDDDDFQVYEDYRGLRPVVAQGAFAPPESRCLLVLLASAQPETEGGGYVGPSFSGCGAGEFPATVQFLIDESLGSELGSAFPDGTALQFVYDEANDEVVVFADR